MPLGRVGYWYGYIFELGVGGDFWECGSYEWVICAGGLIGSGDWWEGEALEEYPCGVVVVEELVVIVEIVDGRVVLCFGCFHGLL